MTLSGESFDASHHIAPSPTTAVDLKSHNPVRAVSTDKARSDEHSGRNQSPPHRTQCLASRGLGTLGTQHSADLRVQQSPAAHLEEGRDASRGKTCFPAWNSAARVNRPRRDDVLGAWRAIRCAGLMQVRPRHFKYHSHHIAQAQPKAEDDSRTTT